MIVETDALTAGRALDALVAEKVFGFKVRETKADEQFPPDGDPLENRGWFWCDKVIVTGRRYDTPLPEYSTFIAAAWEVVEKLSSDSVAVTVTIRGDKATIGAAAICSIEFGGMDRMVAIGETAPLAICRAALKVVL